ncbi:hypothetical protein EG346_17575 [Chryseobacterium carnipullorum]|uniref:Uncharacterized protein n=1 Tax=Chryseobacterium carnipullorum TaxID=1124835 RepID=A0A3G6NIH1_CHRCU|nr:hypothetical protein EG346_17575 [Chryseobacterium carnipullorum]AZA64763.1 hypothetical protein EG345_08600 [Chryseobacterium carnipullorum]
MDSDIAKNSSEHNGGISPSCERNQMFFEKLFIIKMLGQIFNPYFINVDEHFLVFNKFKRF